MGNILKKIQEKLLKTNKIYNTVRRFKSIKLIVRNLRVPPAGSKDCKKVV